MKTVILRHTGGPEVLELVDMPVPAAQTGEIVIRTSVMAVSTPDVLIRKGVYKWMPPLPASPGNELVGHVESVGAGVDSVRAGQAVLLSARELDVRGGCYAEFIRAPVESVHVLPANTDLERAVVLPTYVVAYAMLHGLGFAKTTQSIFVNGATGAVGGALVDLAKAAGIMVIGSVGSTQRADAARALGVDHVIHYRDASMADAVMKITNGRGVDVAFDHVIGPGFLECIRMLADFGCAVAYNVFSPMPDHDVFGELRALSARSLGLRVFNIHTFDKDRSALRSMTRQLIRLLDRGKIQPRIGMRLPLAHAAEAHRLLESGDVVGKIILTP